jgi:Ni/Co efflux regulator RcnB
VIGGAQPRDRHESWRDVRQDARWDDGRHNGYYRDNQWTFGPPQGRYDRADIVYGYQPWQRGQRLGYYQGRYQEVDYRTDRRLRPPPRGYHWVRNDSGDLLLAAIAGGLITQVILASSR